MKALPATKRINKKRSILLHLFGCLCFVILPFLFFPHPHWLSESFNNPITIRDFIGQLILIGFFYLNYYVLIPKYYFTGKRTVFTSLVIGCFALIVLLPSLLTGHFNRALQPSPPLRTDLMKHRPPPKPDGFGNEMGRPEAPADFRPHEHGEERISLIELGHYVFLFLVVLLFSLMLSVNDRWKQTQKEKANAELSYLKAQINPHFLFNTLNSIYSLTILKSDTAPEAVVKLADMMRYVLQEAAEERVSLQKEVEYLKDYIELQRLRFGNQVPVEFIISGEAGNKQIAPLILINFVENAFKHGVNAAENSHIFIHIDVTNDGLILRVRNNKVQVQEGDSNGTGLQNAESRLALLYPGKHQLTIENKDTYFEIILHLWLT